ncbi:MAG: hypothetical protein ACPGO0_03810 [Acidimicrobiales bacterium]
MNTSGPLMNASFSQKLELRVTHCVIAPSEHNESLIVTTFDSGCKECVLDLTWDSSQPPALRLFEEALEAVNPVWVAYASEIYGDACSYANTLKQEKVIPDMYLD